jgi:hypothetical protein
MEVYIAVYMRRPVILTVGITLSEVVRVLEMCGRVPVWAAPRQLLLGAGRLVLTY